MYYTLISQARSEKWLVRSGARMDIRAEFLPTSPIPKKGMSNRNATPAS
jgi:hypothetical protein